MILKSIKAIEIKAKQKQKSDWGKKPSKKNPKPETLYSPEDQMGLECQDFPVHQ